jgi:hypothetical protein
MSGSRRLSGVTVWGGGPVGWWLAASAWGLSVGQVVTEFGSGVNGHRRGLIRLLSDPAVSVLVVECRDRLFGFEYLSVALAACGRRVVVFDDVEATDGLVCDVAEVFTSLCAWLCGRWSVLRGAAKAVAVATGSGQRTPTSTPTTACGRAMAGKAGTVPPQGGTADHELTHAY